PWRAVWPPIPRAARGIELRHLVEGAQGHLEPERVQHGHRAVERGLGRRRAGGLEVHGAELIVVVGPDRRGAQQEEDAKACCRNGEPAGHDAPPSDGVRCPIAADPAILRPWPTSSTNFPGPAPATTSSRIAAAAITSSTTGPGAAGTRSPPSARGSSTCSSIWAPARCGPGA